MSLMASLCGLKPEVEKSLKLDKLDFMRELNSMAQARASSLQICWLNLFHLYIELRNVQGINELVVEQNHQYVLTGSWVNLVSHTFKVLNQFL